MTAHQWLLSCGLVLGLLSPAAEAFSSPRPYQHPVRCKNTRCHILPSFKQRGRADDNVINDENLELDMMSLTNGSSNNLFSSFKPIMQPELDMKSDEQIISKEQQPDGNDSSSSQLVLIGGTMLVLAAAFALGVSMSTELGIDLEWR